MDLISFRGAHDADIALLIEFLGYHAFPSIIMDCGILSNDRPCTSTSLVYSNASFTAWIESSQLSEQAFREWAETSTIWSTLVQGKTQSMPYGRLMWVASFVGGRWAILQSQSRFEEPSLKSIDETSRPLKRKRSSAEEISWEASFTFTPPHPLPSSVASTPNEDGVSRIFDWTRYDIPSAPEFIKWLRNFDWSRTRIGPMQKWSPIIRQITISIMSNPKARCIYFGFEDPVMMYNEACSKLLGHRHPEAMGAHGAVGAGPAWSLKYEAIKEVWDSGLASEHTDYYHPIPRGDLPWEEAYFSWCIMPIVDDSGRMVGVQKEFWETTTEVVYQRRMNTVNRAENMIAWGDSIDTYWTKTCDIIESNPEDFPFCLIFSAPQDLHPEKRGHYSTEDIVPESLKLEGCIGLDHGHPMVVDQFYLTDSDNLLAKQFRTAWIRGDNVLLTEKDRTLPKALQISINGRGHGAVCRSVMICPITRLDGPGSVCFLMFGMNPQRPYDVPYRDFIKSLKDKFVKAAASILVPEEREKLRQQWQKARDQERIFTRLAEFASVGLAIFDASGELTWRNKTYQSLTNVEYDKSAEYGYRLPIHPKDRHSFEETLSKLFSSKDPTYHPFFQFRVQKDTTKEADIDTLPAWRWLLVHASRELDECGNLVWVGIYVADVTPQIHAHERRLEDALETKRESENFIDMTCHEMRNPLSAIIQSADGIIGSFTPNSLEDASSSTPQVELDLSGPQATILDSAQTILLCAQHQKRIVDDILTLSKLDSNLLLIAPDRIRPIALIERALSMYEAELADAKICATFKVDQSYIDLGVDLVLLDPARLLQILINLLTNAIKFTRKENAKRISVILGASISPPSAGTTNVSFIPQRTTRADVMTSSEWGKGEDVYLHFDVCDTGKGLTGEEMGHLFRRFSQASAKTYSQYGGSGLGLFISRELTELQGGQIGVYSVAGQGSTFAFYIRARRYKPEPTDEKAQDLVQADLVPSVEISEPTTQNPSDLHILLVEDNLINQKVTANQLRKLGCTVHVANHGLECLDFLEKSCYWYNEDASPDEAATPLSVILLDQEMPVMDGLTCVRRIREMQQEGKVTGHVPVLACTGNARMEQVADSLEAGMDGVVTKPFRINELLPRMFEVIESVQKCEMEKT